MRTYGKELILDLFECDISVNDRDHLEQFFIGLCDLIKMERAVNPITGENLAWYWTEGYDQEEHITGTSAVQFIRTSNVMVHTLSKLKTVYINIFSCKEFNSIEAIQFAVAFFHGQIKNSITLERG